MTHENKSTRKFLSLRYYKDNTLQLFKQLRADVSVFYCEAKSKGKITRLEVFLGKHDLKICSKFTGKHPYRNTISVKLLCNFIGIRLRHGCSPVNLLHIFRIPLLRNTSGGLLLEEQDFKTCLNLKFVKMNLIFIINLFVLIMNLSMKVDQNYLYKLFFETKL